MDRLKGQSGEGAAPSIILEPLLRQAHNVFRKLPQMGIFSFSRFLLTFWVGWPSMKSPNPNLQRDAMLFASF